MSYRFQAFVAIALLAAASTIYGPFPARAGAVITVEQRVPWLTAPVVETVHVNERFIRIEIDSHVTIYDAQSDVRSEFDKRKRTFYEASTRQTSRLIAEVLAHRRRIAKEAERLPPRQRFEVEQILLMRNSDVGSPLDAIYSDLARTETVGKWRCRVYALHLDGEKRAESCVVPLAEVGLTVNDLRATNEMARAASAVAAGGSGYARIVAAADPARLDKVVGFPAFAVRTENFRDGRPSITATVVAVERRNLPPAVFVGPSDFRKELLPALPGRERDS